jgi:hypothetical protein
VAWVYGNLEGELGWVVGKGYSGEESRHANKNVHIKGKGSDGSWPKEKRKKKE